jgi:hypothetical protein
MKLFNQWIKEDKEINSTLNEKKTIVTVYDDKKIVFSDKEIKELLDQVLDKDDVIMNSDNLPGWLHKASLNNQDFPKSRKKIADFLQQILDSKKDVKIDIDSKKPPYLNNIIIENNESVNSKNTDLKYILNKIVKDELGFDIGKKYNKEDSKNALLMVQKLNRTYGDFIKMRSPLHINDDTIKYSNSFFDKKTNESVNSKNVEDFVKSLPKTQKHEKYKYELAMITDDNIFYINFEDGLDDNASTLCYDLNMELLSSNYHATNKWVSILDKNKGEGYLWVSSDMKKQIVLMREAGEFDHITESFTIASSLNEWLSLKEKNDDGELDPEFVKKMQQKRLNGDFDNATITSLADDGIKLTDYLKFKKEYSISSLDGAPASIGLTVDPIYIITRSIIRKLEKREFINLETFNKWAEDFGAYHYEIYGPYPNEDARDAEFKSGKPTLVNHSF